MPPPDLPPPAPPPPESPWDLEEAQMAAWCRWMRLFVETDWRDDPEARRAMLRARLAYQETMGRPAALLPPGSGGGSRGRPADGRQA